MLNSTSIVFLHFYILFKYKEPLTTKIPHAVLFGEVHAISRNGSDVIKKYFFVVLASAIHCFDLNILHTRIDLAWAGYRTQDVAVRAFIFSCFTTELQLSPNTQDKIDNTNVILKMITVSGRSLLLVYFFPIDQVFFQFFLDNRRARIRHQYRYNNKSCCHNGVKFLSNLLFE